MTRDDERLQEAILRYMEKCGGKKGSLWTLARACYSVGWQARKKHERTVRDFRTVEKGEQE